MPDSGFFDGEVIRERAALRFEWWPSNDLYRAARLLPLQQQDEPVMLADRGLLVTDVDFVGPPGLEVWTLNTRIDVAGFVLYLPVLWTVATQTARHSVGAWRSPHGAYIPCGQELSPSVGSAIIRGFWIDPIEGLGPRPVDAVDLNVIPLQTAGMAETLAGLAPLVVSSEPIPTPETLENLCAAHVWSTGTREDIVTGAEKFNEGNREPGDASDASGQEGAFEAAYDKSVEAWSAESAAALDADLKTIERSWPVAAKDSVLAAKEAGIDWEAAQSQIAALSQLPVEEATKRVAELNEELRPKVADVVERLQVDADQLRVRILGELPLPDKVQPLTGRMELGWLWTSTSPPSTAPSELRLTPPYALHHTTTPNARADAQTGQLFVRADAFAASTGVEVAAVGGLFPMPADAALVRAEVIIEVRWETSATALLGYASAESVVHLKLLDGSRTVGEDRASLARSLAPGFWVNDQSSVSSIALACEFRRQRAGLAVDIGAVVEVQAWAGAAGNAIAYASARTEVRAIDISFGRGDE